MANMLSHDIPYHKSEHEVRSLQVRTLSLMTAPILVAFGMQKLADHFDTPLSSPGYESAGQADIESPTHEIILTDGIWAGQAQPDDLINTTDFYDQQIIEISDDNDASEIAGHIAEYVADLPSSMTHPLLVDVDVIHPDTLILYPLSDSVGLATDENAIITSPILSYSATSTLGTEALDSAFIDTIRSKLAANHSEVLRPDITIFPKSGMTVDIPYTVSQFSRIMDIAQDYGYDTFDELNAAIAHPDVEQQLVERFNAVAADMNGLEKPTIVVTAMLENAAGKIDTPHSKAATCALPVKLVNATYEQVEPTRYPHDLKLLLAESVVLGALSFRRKKHTRWINNTAVPAPEVLVQVKNGTASTFDKLHTLMYLQELENNPKEKKTGYSLNHRTLPATIMLTSIGLGLMALANFTHNHDKYRKTTAEQESLPDFVIGGNCDNDMYVLLSSGASITEKTIVTTDPPQMKQIAPVVSGK